VALSTEQKRELLDIQNRLKAYANGPLTLTDARILLNTASAVVWLVAKEDAKTMRELVSFIPPKVCKEMA